MIYYFDHSRTEITEISDINDEAYLEEYIYYCWAYRMSFSMFAVFMHWGWAL